MIHHVSIPARDPERVATALAQLLGGYSGRFAGAIPGAWAVYADDAHGTGIEVVPEQTVLVPGPDQALGGIASAAPPAAFAFHALISVSVDGATIERVCAREGWRVVRGWRGPPGNPLFELYECWVENRVLLELATEQMVGDYLAVSNEAAQRRLLQAAAAARAHG